jgi:DNA-binding XRE family transcriptional regulator
MSRPAHATSPGPVSSDDTARALALVSPALQPHTAVIDGRRLRQLRRERGLSQDDLAFKARVGRTTVARLERHDRSRCRLFTLTRLARQLGTDPAALAVLVRISKNAPPAVPQPGGSLDGPTPPARLLIAPSRKPARRSD